VSWQSYLVVEMPIFYVPSCSDSPQTGEGWLANALSEGATLDSIFRYRGAVSAWLSTYGESMPISLYPQ
jgi:hypothetical protein